MSDAETKSSPAGYLSMSLRELKLEATSLGITEPAGHKGHKSTWISAIEDMSCAPPSTVRTSALEGPETKSSSLREEAVEDADVVQEYLTRTGYSGDHPNDVSLDPIHAACFRGDTERVRQIMDHEGLACLDTYSNYPHGHPMCGWRALEFAQAGKHSDLVSILEDYRDDDDSEEDDDDSEEDDDDSEEDDED